MEVGKQQLVYCQGFSAGHPTEKLTAVGEPLGHGAVVILFALCGLLLGKLMVFAVERDHCLAGGLVKPIFRRRFTDPNTVPFPGIR
jgi:hypothetical protein